MYNRLRLLCAPLLAALLTAPVHATAPCDVVVPLSALEGAFDVSIGNALIRDETQIVPLRALNTFRAEMEAQGESLMMEADSSVVVLKYAGPEVTPLNYGELGSVLNVDAADFPALLGCGIDRLPGLIGGGRAESQEGTPIEFEYELVVWDISTSGHPQMFGIVRWGGGGVKSVRAVTVTPVR